jgi:hypothetical protein
MHQISFNVLLYTILNFAKFVSVRDSKKSKKWKMSTDFNEHKQIKSALLLCKSRVGTTISNIPNIAIHQAFTQP